MESATVVTLLHPRLGLCELIRVEGTDWIVKARSSGVHFRVPAEKRSQFQVVQDAPQPAVQPPIKSIPAPPSAGTRNARRVIESLRVGLPSLDGSTRHLAVGFRETTNLVKAFLHDVDAEGGGAVILKGSYGQGKSFSLTMLEDMALEAGYITARTEIDATENRLNKPHHIYRDLMRHLRLPNASGEGGRCLALRVQELLQQRCPGQCFERMRWLNEQLGCGPLAWLFSDSLIAEKPPLLGLLEADPNYRVGSARNCHCYPATPRFWPAFTAGTQGDFASYLLSGIGRLARLLGYRGFVVIMDEMEKWYELNWAEQSRAGNLLGGLIWGATAEQGHRGRDDHPTVLMHSGRCGGFPFTTVGRSHVGIAIAMTPRDDSYAEILWACYGRILVGQVPSMTDRRLVEYCRLVMPFFARAYGIKEPQENELKSIAGEAIRIWKSGEVNTRFGVQAAIAAFDHWREMN